MHYYILQTCHLDAELDVAFFVDNIVSVCLDLLFVFIAIYWLVWRRIKVALAVCFMLTWLWSFSSIMYSRFFYHYLSLSAIGQGGALADDLIIQCVMSNLHFADLYYPCIAILFVSMLLKYESYTPLFSWKSILVGFCLLFLSDFGVHAVCCFSNPQLRYISYYIHRLESNHLVNHLNYSQPNLAHFLRGEVRTLFAELVINVKGNIELTEQQINEIIQVAANSKASLSECKKAITPSNVIFILVESYMSFSSDMKVGGKEVTPFLNSLKRDSSVYYNGKIKKNITIGSSSDGQFIYMTGLLPLRSVITLSQARHVTLPGISKLLGRESRMIIPTVTSIWAQDEMCQQYGFDHLYSRDDYVQGIDSNLTDEQVFQLAIQKDKESKQPFFSVILTISMHQPFKKQVDPTFPVNDPAFTTDLANYLNVCHYTDKQIERYFAWLKDSGLYDNSLIVIAADHPVGNANFGNVGDDIPLYIINAAGLPQDMWQGECNQLDVYTTLLDLLGCKSDWYGLGHSLVSPNYKNSVSDRVWDVSEWIIMGDYFSRK